MILRSGMWSVFGTVGEKVLTVTTYALVTRQVGVRELGDLVLALLVIEFLVFIASFGIKENITRINSEDHDFFVTCFRFLLAVTAIFFIFYFFIIIPVFHYFSGQNVSDLLTILALYVPLKGMAGYHQGLLQNRMDFKRLAIRRVAVAFISGMAGVWSVVAGFGLMSIVIAKYVYASLDLLALYIMTLGSVDGSFRRGHIPDIIEFGWKFTSSQVVNFISSKANEIIAVTLLGTAALAIMDVGRKLLITLYGVLLTALSPVILAALSKTNDSDQIDLYHALNRITILLVVPVVGSLGGVSDQVIHTLFGDEWGESSMVLSILAFSVIPQALSWHLGNILLARGKAGLLIWLNFSNFISLVLAGLFTGVTDGDLKTLCVSIVVAQYVSCFIKVLIVVADTGAGVLSFLVSFLGASAAFSVSFIVSRYFSMMYFDTLFSGSINPLVALILYVMFVLVVQLPYILIIFYFQFMKVKNYA